MPDGVLPPGLLPRFLSRIQAAAYVGVSPGVFDAEVKSGRWPAADRRGAKGGTLTWDRHLLDRWADRRAGLLAEEPAAAVDMSAEEEALRRAAQTDHGNQGGRKKEPGRLATAR